MNRRWIFKKGLMASVVPALVLVVAAGFGKAEAEDPNAPKQFAIEAVLTSASTESQYEVQVTVTNNGPDFDGYVRISPESSYAAAAYDKELSLAQGTTKQYTMVIPADSVRSGRAATNFTVLDKKERIMQEDELYGVFAFGESTLPVAVISDDFDSLTYIDLSGNEVYIFDDDRSIKLRSMSPDELETNLDAYKFLIIDKFDTSVLTDDQLDAIVRWMNDDGGVMILGTGDYAHEVLDTFLDKFVWNISLPESNIYDPSKGKVYASDGYTFDYFTEELISSGEMTMAVPVCNDYTFYEGYLSASLNSSQGRGGVSILYYSLTDPYLRNYASGYDVENLIPNIFTTAADMAGSMTGYSSLTDSLFYDAGDMFARIDAQNADISLGLVFAVLFIYAGLSGPALYFILKGAKKREWYWVAAPALAVVFVGIIWGLSSKYSVRGLTADSVTIAEASGEGIATSYVMAYSSGTDEWKAKVREDALYAQEAFWKYGSSDEYKDRIISANDGWYVGGKPGQSFDQLYFSVGWPNYQSGRGFVPNGVQIDSSGDLLGSITNETGMDMAFLLVTDGENVFVKEDVMAGDTVDFDGWYYASYSDPSIENYTYEVLQPAYYDYTNSGTTEDTDELAALYLGLATAYSKGELVAVGVAKDGEGVMASNAAETAYTCLYSVIK